MSRGHLCDILLACKKIAANAKIKKSPIGSELVKLGYISPEKVGKKPRVMIWWDGDRAQPVDDYLDHNVRLFVGVQAPYDESDGTLDETALLHATRVYFAVFDAFEDAATHLAESGLGAVGVQTLSQSQPGAEPDGFATPGPVFAGTHFDLNYQRDTPATRY